jgi:hypothetical protein
MCPEGQVYTFQANECMDEQVMMKLVDEVWGPYTKYP